VDSDEQKATCKNCEQILLLNLLDWDPGDVKNSGK
jgi:hypothetical protein